MFEILYQGSEALTFVVEEILQAHTNDPFEILSMIEEESGIPLVFNMFNLPQGESDM